MHLILKEFCLSSESTRTNGDTYFIQNEIFDWQIDFICHIWLLNWNLGYYSIEIKDRIFTSTNIIHQPC